MVSTTSRIAAEFSLSWIESKVKYKERYYINKIDFWRDILPQTLQRKMESLTQGECCSKVFSQGELVEAYSQQQLVSLSKKNIFKNPSGQIIKLKKGRFYPESIAWRELSSFPGVKRAFRVVDETKSNFFLDKNHPLSRYELSVTVKVLDIYKPVVQRGGSLNNIIELICQDGPGMQVPLADTTNETFGYSPFLRRNSLPEEEFYRKPRLVQHLDSTARHHITKIYDKLLTPKMKILDLMSSVESHLSEKFIDSDITGVGMNEQEMEANPFLKHHVIQNLNVTPTLPFADCSFDALLCTASLEYLSSPHEVMAEVERVLTPGGVVVLVFSDRWFSGEEIVIWSELHPFERQGFALQLLLDQQGLSNFHTESVRNFPRAFDDKYYGERFVMDPVFAVWAKKGA